MAVIQGHHIALEARSVLVMTDAYPPYAAGGAEISLGATLRSLDDAERGRLCILAFTEGLRRLETTVLDNVLVVHAPRPLAWPHNHLTPEQTTKMLSNRGLMWRIKGRIEREYRSRMSPHARDQSLAYSESATHPRGGIMTDYLIRENDYRVSVAVEIAQAMTLEQIVCDNSRSILIGDVLLRQLSNRPHATAIVRDNRFHCARPSQNRTVNGQTCRDCNFQCAKEDVASGAVPLRKEALERTQRHRTRALNAFDQVVVTSRELARHVHPTLNKGIPLHRIPNGLGRLEVIDSWTAGIQQSTLDEIVIVGMLNENKGQLKFLKSAASWLQQRPNVRITLLGRGERIGAEISEFLQSHQLGAQVRMPGYLPRRKVFEQIARSKLVVAPTVWPEPFGRVPLEAGAARRTVVAFGMGGLNESIIHGKTGLLVRPNDYFGLLTAIDSLLDDPQRRKEMEAASRRLVETRYGKQETTDRFADIVFRNARKSGSKREIPASQPLIH
jgi:hypothetical protein